MKIRTINLGKGLRYGKGKLEGNVLTVGKKKYLVVTLFPREVRTVLSFGLRKKTLLYAVCMDGEPRTLARMENFQTDSFATFLTDTLESVKKNGTSIEEANKALWEWKGPDDTIEGIETEPWLERKFRMAPITDEQLHLAITDSQRTKIMRGGGWPEWVFILIGLAIGALITGLAFYSGIVTSPTTGPDGPPTVILGEIMRWL